MTEKYNDPRLSINNINIGRPDNNCNCNDNNCNIKNVYASQGSYQNECNSSIQQCPSIQIAFLSNVNNDCNADRTITLNPVNINWCDFMILFYQTNRYFNVNSANYNSCMINFANQTYENVTCQANKFNLAQQVRFAWANKCETSIDNIPPKLNILLNRDTFGIRSLLNASSSVSLTLDEVIDTLLTNGDIEQGDSTTSATVRFLVQFKYCFKPLNTCVLVEFVFVTSIPCYKLTNLCDDWCPPYSNDTGCRNCGDLTFETNDIMNFLNENYKNYNNDITNDDDNDDTISNYSELITNLMDNNNKTYDEQTQISLDSSKW